MIHYENMNRRRWHRVHISNITHPEMFLTVTHVQAYAKRPTFSATLGTAVLTKDRVWKVRKRLPRFQSSRHPCIPYTFSTVSPGIAPACFAGGSGTAPTWSGDHPELLSSSWVSSNGLATNGSVEHTPNGVCSARQSAPRLGGRFHRSSLLVRRINFADGSRPYSGNLPCKETCFERSLDLVKPGWEIRLRLKGLEASRPPHCARPARCHVLGW